MLAFISIPSPSKRLVLQGENIHIAIADEGVRCVLDIRKPSHPHGSRATYDTEHSVLGAGALCHVDASEIRKYKRNERQNAG